MSWRRGFASRHRWRLRRRVPSPTRRISTSSFARRAGAGACTRRRGARIGRPSARLDVDRLGDLRARGLSVRRSPNTWGAARRPSSDILGALDGGPTTTIPSNATRTATAALRPRMRPMAWGPHDRKMRGPEDAALLDMAAAPLEPLDDLFGPVRPRVRGPFSRRVHTERRVSEIGGGALFRR